MTNNAYPRWITTSEGNKIIVQNRAQHAVHTGKYVTEQGVELDESPVAPVVTPIPEPAAIAIPPQFETPDSEPKPTTEGRVMKLYPCGCSAGPGPADMPEYCPTHGSAEQTEECLTIPHEETATPAVVEDEAGIFQD